MRKSIGSRLTAIAKAMLIGYVSATNFLYSAKAACIAAPSDQPEVLLGSANSKNRHDSIVAVRADAQLDKASPPYTVTPLFADLHAAGPDNEATITVCNKSEKSIALAIRVLGLEIAEDGTASTKEDQDSFSIYPQQQKINARAAKTFHLEWMKRWIRQSESFYVEVYQLSEEAPGKSVQIENLYNFKTVVNVAPPSGTSSLEIEEVKVILDPNKKRHPQLTVSDNGNSYAKLSDATVMLKGGRWSLAVAPERLRQLIGMGLVQPGRRRCFLIPIDIPDDITDLTAQVFFEGN